jgi:NAD(P)-dependent dehydrogenase (short-subunit alcohol dehydrogenase family)
MLKDKVIVITGASRGIGEAIARACVDAGARVCLASRKQADLDRVAAALGDKAIAVACHTGKAEDVDAMFARAVEKFGRVDGLVNNAATNPYFGPLIDTPDAAIDKTFEVNVKGYLYCARALVRHARDRGGGGSIVNIASVHGLLVAPGRLVYETGKAAVIAATRQTACDFGPIGIRVNAICPGHIVTERMQRRWGENQAGVEFFEQHYPIRRVGRPVDIANAVVFLVSDEASFVTGHTMVVDGGMTIQLQEDLAVNTVHYIREHPDTAMPY